MKKKIFLFVAAVLFVVFFSQIRLGVITTLFLWDLLDETTVSTPDRGTLAWVTPQPSVKAVAVPDRKSTRLNSSHIQKSRMPSSA